MSDDHSADPHTTGTVSVGGSRESYWGGKRVEEVARRYGVSCRQLSAWRSLARQGQGRCAVIGGAAASVRDARGGQWAVRLDGDIGSETGMRVVVGTRPVNFRKGHDGLAAVMFSPKRLDGNEGCGATANHGGTHHV